MLKKYLLIGLTLTSLSYITPGYSATQDSEDNLKCIEELITNPGLTKDERSNKKAEVYEKAASKRRKAAEIQAKQAGELLDKANEERYSWIKGETKKQEMERYNRVGEYELKAADFQINSSLNYLNASYNDQCAIDNYRKIPKDKSEKLKKNLAEDTSNSSINYKQAVESCINASKTFELAENNEKRAKANEKAAGILEYLVKEK